MPNDPRSAAVATTDRLCLHELIEHQARTTPLAVAAEYEGETLSYAALDRRANQLANHLRQLGVGPEVPVGLCLDRSLELIVGLLATLKAGGCYVPLNPEYPLAHLSAVLADTHPTVVLTQDRHRYHVPDTGAEVIQLDHEWEAISSHPTSRPGSGVTAQNLAYVLHTSGSTGRPKGVMISHHGICNRLLWCQERYQLDPSDAVLQKTPISFDVSGLELFWPLLAGARLVLARPGGHRLPDYLAEVINESRITTINFVPTMLDQFLAAGHPCPTLRRVIACGEAVTAATVRRFQQTYRSELHNLYGPTEASVHVTAWACPPDLDQAEPVPIGRPIPGTRIHILDDAHRQVPPGATGELWVAGAGLARGYRGRPGLTAERFLPDPFGEPGARMYRTGDLGRWGPHGEIEFLGRVDDQVKIRGNRVEPGAVEAALAGYPGVAEVAVVARDDPDGGRRLVGYVVPEDGVGLPGGNELRVWLGNVLPDFMVPAAILELPRLPVTVSGKVDRAALPEPAPGPTTSGREPLRIATDSIMARICAEVLDIESVEPDGSFVGLGGDSLRGIQVVRRARRAGLRVTLQQLLEAPSVAELAREVG
jgi:amino acid adenylation domain-containing protein